MKPFMFMMLMLGMLVSLDSVAITLPQTSQAEGRPRLEWTVPVLRRNGDALSVEEIAGYRIAYGPPGDATPTYAAVEGGAMTYWVGPMLGVGTYEFAAQAVDVNGVQGDWTPKVMLTISDDAPSSPGDFIVELIRQVVEFLRLVFGRFA